MAESEDEEPLTLSSHALGALKDFYSERDDRAKQFEALKHSAEQDAQDRKQAAPLSMSVFGEDWNKSQFWYCDETAKVLAEQLLVGADASTRIAVVSAPSVFVALRNILAETPSEQPKPALTLLEHDERFEVFPEYVFYDYAQPFKLPGNLKGAFTRIICDPPFLNEDCQTKAAITVRWLHKMSETQSGTSSSNDGCRLIVCTGERMESTVTKLYKSFDLHTTDYQIVHARGLSNEFYCYANFECEAWKQRVAATIPA